MDLNCITSICFISFFQQPVSQCIEDNPQLCFSLAISLFLNIALMCVLCLNHFNTLSILGISKTNFFFLFKKIVRDILNLNQPHSYCYTYLIKFSMEFQSMRLTIQSVIVTIQNSSLGNTVSTIYLRYSCRLLLLSLFCFFFCFLKTSVW